MKTVITLATMVAAATSLVYVRPADAGCKVTVKAHYKKEVKDPVTKKRVEKLTLNLLDSDVRAKPGWWKKMENMCNPNQLTVSFNGSISTSCELDLACGKRQFRFDSYFIDGNGNKQGGEITYVPAVGEWKDLDTSTTIDVGELGDQF